MVEPKQLTFLNDNLQPRKKRQLLSNRQAIQEATKKLKETLKHLSPKDDDKDYEDDPTMRQQAIFIARDVGTAINDYWQIAQSYEP